MHTVYEIHFFLKNQNKPIIYQNWFNARVVTFLFVMIYKCKFRHSVN